MSDLSRRDFMSDQTIRWCPGCGDYSILAQLQTAFAQIGLPRERYAVISGIGCSSRLPYYVETYGFHTIHGRAPAVATGLKLARPELSVWVITGDGDGLSIGGNHLAHVLRRNVDLSILLFNNRIYGLTKGQFSPTSEIGKRTKSSPSGVVDPPLNPAAFAIGTGATHVARSVDVLPKHLREALVDAHEHRGSTFLEILQNCNIFNDGAFADYTDRAHRDDRILYLKPGAPLVWGKETLRGLVQDGFGLRVEILDGPEQAEDCLRHNPSDRNLAWALATLEGPHAPLILGTLYQTQRPTYESEALRQISDARATLGEGDIKRLLRASDSFKVRRE
ncbi:MAG: 2-oxoacid:ferredoxin oxidoreductase subunit beta [Deltaproteobacteria bacterium]|nr:MAG: 2-oxoacid:ferredoxin oxidoreductase subunit beta [Deltaproteobacteria bacterium]